MFGSFHPPWYLRSGQIQTVLASMPLRAWGKNPAGEAAREITIKTPRGIRLQGYHSSQTSAGTRGWVILLHGWEGSADSTYIACTGKSLYQRGYDIFRLNFRDHGSSHHLNQGIFYAILLEEVFQALQQICSMAEEKPVFLMGLSMGAMLSIIEAARRTPEGLIIGAPALDLKNKTAYLSPVLKPMKQLNMIL